MRLSIKGWEIHECCALIAGDGVEELEGGAVRVEVVAGDGEEEAEACAGQPRFGAFGCAKPDGAGEGVGLRRVAEG